MVFFFFFLLNNLLKLLDTYTIKNSKEEKIQVSDKNIAWPSDKDNKFKRNKKY